MSIKVGINGFGRIGRMVFRASVNHPEIEIVGINDLCPADYLAYMLKYDTMHGQFQGTVEHTENAIIVNGREIPIFAERNPADLPWGKIGAEYVVESTGLFLTKEKSQAHLDAGAKKVLISAPAKDETTPTVVFGVNHDILKKDDNIVSAGSCTTNSMAAMVKLLNDKWGIKAGFMTTIHAYTGTQMILDGPRGNKSGRALRAAAVNTIPHSTGAAKAIGKVVPEVNGKLQGHAQRVQVPDGSITELFTVLDKEATVDEINAAFKDAFEDCAYYGYNDDEIVSGDIVGDTHGGVFDPTQTDVNEVDGVTMVRTVAFYDNEYGFTSNMVRTLEYFAEISE